MNDYFQENKRSFLVLAGLLFILSIILFLIILRPLTADLSSKEKDIQSVEDEIQILQKKLENMNQEVIDKDVEQLISEKEIPSRRDLDEYILSLQRLEVRTKSKIEKIEFMYDSNLVEEEEAELADETDSTTESTTEQDELDDLEVTEAITIDPVILDEKPENLQVMTIKVTGASPDFDELINLLKVIENQDRISIVNKLTFLKPAEYDTFFPDDPIKTISFEAELSTFYYVE